MSTEDMKLVLDGKPGDMHQGTAPSVDSLNISTWITQRENQEPIVGPHRRGLQNERKTLPSYTLDINLICRPYKELEKLNTKETSK